MAVTLDETVAFLKRREAESRARADTRARSLRERLPAARQLLTERYGARRVILFGSLARDTTTERSDVDLAVEGLRPLAYFTAVADLTGLFDAPVDLVELETASASMRARLDFEGIEL